MRCIINILLRALKFSVHVTLRVLNAALIIIGIIGFISNIRTKNIFGMFISWIFIIIGIIFIKL